MRRRPFPTLAALPVFACAALATVGGIPSPVRACRVAPPAYTMEIFVDGRELPALAGNGATYVEALKGRPYSVRLTNRTGGRVAVALAVDGLNVIDAKRTSMREARKWILDPWGSITLDGWQVSSGSARRFVFTNEQGSYGAWLGKTDDLGVVSAAFFRERVPEPRRDRIDAPAQAPAPMELGSAGAKKEKDAKARANEEYAATGIGEKIDHRVFEVAFDEEASPAAVVTLRYEYRDALVRLGVLPKDDGALARRERSRGFADSGFAPDPYRN